tara:strand:- start:91 stop:276 length:186 start_codon:yes stop_codon:yes gene_type:complete
LDFDTIGFNLSSSNKTFLAINGCEYGFQSKNDLLIEITGYNGDLENINISSGDFSKSKLIM